MFCLKFEHKIRGFEAFVVTNSTRHTYIINLLNFIFIIKFLRFFNLKF